MEKILAELVELSHRLGDPALDWAILGEGNSSADLGDGTFLVKASGVSLGTAARDDFIRVRAGPVLALLDTAADDQAVHRTLREARVAPRDERMPSVETFVHAVCLERGIHFVGHTHPTPLLALLCSAAFADLAGRLFPDQVVVCGAHPLLVPYTDPGLELARAIRGGLADFVERHGVTPRTILLQNHGLVALGESARQVLDITAMAVKAARVLAGTYAAGGPHFLAEGTTERIDTRGDEHYRQRVMAGERGPAGAEPGQAGGEA
jgi:rhamnose utilization protein RhaD (predicted bifunctional aldolase and dehydrogenase)